jgi:hypothetical protein
MLKFRYVGRVSQILVTVGVGRILSLLSLVTISVAHKGGLGVTKESLTGRYNGIDVDQRYIEYLALRSSSHIYTDFRCSQTIRRVWLSHGIIACIRHLNQSQRYWPASHFRCVFRGLAALIDGFYNCSRGQGCLGVDELRFQRPGRRYVQQTRERGLGWSNLKLPSSEPVPSDER